MVTFIDLVLVWKKYECFYSVKSLIRLSSNNVLKYWYIAIESSMFFWMVFKSWLFFVLRIYYRVGLVLFLILIPIPILCHKTHNTRHWDFYISFNNVIYIISNVFVILHISLKLKSNTVFYLLKRKDDNFFFP